MGRDWSLTQFVNAPESRWEHNFDVLPPVMNQSFIHPIENWEEEEIEVIHQ